MFDALSEELFSQYLDESRDHLSQLFGGILSLEKKGFIPDIIDTIYRHTHSFKGISKAVGLHVVVTISHTLEDFVEDIKNKTVPIEKETINLLLEYTDLIEDFLNRLEKSGGKTVSESGIKKKLKELAGKVKELKKKFDREGLYEKLYIFRVMTEYQESQFFKGREAGKKSYVVTLFFKKDEFPEKYKLIKKSLISSGEIIAVTGSHDSIPQGFNIALALLFNSTMNIEELKDITGKAKCAIKEIPENLNEIDTITDAGVEKTEEEGDGRDEEVGAKDLDEELKELRKSFIDESIDELINVTPLIISLESASKDRDTVNEIFRTFHSLKGAGGTFKLFQITEVAHELETVIDKVRKEKMEVSSLIIDLLLEGIDCLSNIFMDAQKGRITEGKKFPLLDKIHDFLSTASPDVKKPQDKKIDVLQTGEPIEQPAPTEPVKIAPKSSETIRVNLDKLDHLVNVFGELILYKNVEEYHEKSMERLKRIVKNNCRKFQKSKEDLVLDFRSNDSRENGELTSFIKETDKSWKEIESFILDICQDFQENISRGKFLIEELQDEILKIRMLPVSTILNQYHRLVRDLSQKKGIKVSLDITGGEIELDKWILEEINDPLIHLIRNAVDHGIEPPEERAAIGKEENGTISLSVTQKGNHVVIAITDNGGGINSERLKEIVLQKGLVESEKLNKLSDQEILQFIFLPGFSTIKKVSDISGRGVGMDVVKTNLKKINGMIDVVTEPGKGTTFSMKVPLTMAIRRAILLKEDNKIFAITTEAIEKIYLIHKSEIEVFTDVGTIQYGDSTIPLVQLRNIMNIMKQAPLKEHLSVIIVGSAEEKIGILVEKVLFEQEIVVKSFGSMLGKIPKFSGTTVLPDGGIALVIDVPSLVDIVTGGAAENKIERIIERKLKRKKTILLVEDSAITRNLFKGIIESLDYRVLTAVDGNDALSVLEKNKIDLVITDIIMPSLDGYKLISRMKNISEYKNIPVIIVSSKGKEEEKIKGLECGADAYIVKGDFERQKLLGTIGNLI